MSNTVIIILIIVAAVFVLGRLTSRKNSTSVRLSGPDTYEFDIVGEASYQDALSKICGGKKEESVEHYADAELYLEDDNPHDKEAVCVLIEGKTVGYLSRKEARVFRKQIKELGQENSILLCKAVIVGGWRRSKSDEGNFGVRLDLPTA